MTKVNELRGEVELTIDDDILTLIPSYENIAAMERALGMGITGLLFGQEGTPFTSLNAEYFKHVVAASAVVDWPSLIEKPTTY